MNSQVLYPSCKPEKPRNNRENDNYSKSEGEIVIFAYNSEKSGAIFFLLHYRVSNLFEVAFQNNSLLPSQTSTFLNCVCFCFSD